MDKLPIELVNKIYEFASDHHEKFGDCVCQIIRHKAAKVYMDRLLFNYGWEKWTFHEIVRVLATESEFDKYFKQEYEYIQSQKYDNKIW